MLVSLSTGSLYLYPLRWIFSLARSAGFDGVEVVIGPETDLRGPEYVRRLSAEFGLPIFSVHPPLYGYPGWSGINLTYAPYMDKATQFADAVGARVLVVHPPRAHFYDKGVGKEFVENVARTRGTLNGVGPRLGLENGSQFHAGDKHYILRALPELRDLAEKLDLQMTLDTSHIGTWNLDLLSSLDFFDGRVANVHFSDLSNVPHWVMSRPRLHSYFRQHQFPGEGTLPLRECLRELAARGYTGPLTYELSPLAIDAWAPWRVTRRLRSAVQFVRDSLAAGQ